MFSMSRSNGPARSSGSTRRRSGSTSATSDACSTTRTASTSAPVRREVPAWALSSAVIAGGVVAWQVLVRALGVPIVLVPAPTDVARALVAGLVNGSLPAQAWVTLQEILIGFGMAGVAGLVAALLVTQLRLVEKAFLPLIVLTQSVPKVAMAPLLLIWFGTGITSKVITTALIAFFPVLV